jgi:hypothetical protein
MQRPSLLQASDASSYVMPMDERQGGDPDLHELFERFNGQLVSPGGAAALLGLSRTTIYTLGTRGRPRATVPAVVSAGIDRAGHARRQPCRSRNACDAADLRHAYGEHVARKADTRVAQPARPRSSRHDGRISGSPEAR